MKKNNKTLIIILVVLLIMLIIILLFKKSNNTEINNNFSNLNYDINNSIFNKNKVEIKQVVNNNNLYFSLSNIINEYYNLVFYEDNKSLLNILSKDYISSNNITESNMHIGSNDYKSLFYINEVVQTNYNDNVYYFVSGVSMNFDIDDIYIESIYSRFLIILKNGCFCIEPLISSESLIKLAKDYKYKDVVIESNLNNKYETNSLSNVQIATYLNNYFVDLLYFEPYKAYDCLSSDMKNKYPSYELFYADIDDIADIFSNKIFGENVTKKDNNTIYDLDMYGNYNIIINQKNFLDFTVEFK